MILTEEMLEQFYSYYKGINTDEHLQEYINRLAYTLRQNDIRVYRNFSYLIEALGYNKLPEIASDKEFKKNPSELLYRGTPDLNNLANQLVDYDYHKGNGVDYMGIHATALHERAEKYTCGNKDSVMEFKLSPDTKFLDRGPLTFLMQALTHDIENSSGYDCLKRLRIDLDETTKQNYKTVVDFYRKHKADPNFQRFIQDTIVDSPSNVALLLGYDAIHASLWIPYEYVVLNRSKMVVSESEFKRITDASKNYKGGVINFDKKTDDEFLRE